VSLCPTVVKVAPCILDTLNDHDLERAIVQSTTESIDEALHLALRYEAYDMSNRTPSLRNQSLILN
jgi:hypothetical protein